MFYPGKEAPTGEQKENNQSLPPLDAKIGVKNWKSPNKKKLGYPPSFSAN
ncbi:MAG: hypothetical protein ACOY3U_06540 [Bacillota bacterium]